MSTEPNNQEEERLKGMAIDLESTARNNIGIDFLRSGNLDEAEKYIQDALNIAINQKDSLTVVKWKANLAAVYARQKKFEIAVKYFDETLPQLAKLRSDYAAKFKESKDTGDRFQEKNLATGIGIFKCYYGTILREKGKLQEAVNYHKESVRSLNQSKFRKFEARARVELGLDYLAQNKTKIAEEEFVKAYQLSKSIKARDEQIVALDGIMRTWQSRNKNLAILYGKQSVNLLQTARSELKELGEKFASEFVKDNKNTYRKLADILVAEGRIAEAEQVLRMLKEEELSNYLRRDDKVAKELLAKIQPDSAEREAIQRFDAIADEITKIGKEVSELEESQKTFPPGKFPGQAELDALEKNLEDARTVFRKFLEELSAKYVNNETKQGDARVKELSATQTLLKELNQPKTVIISTIVGEDRLNIVVTTSKIRRAHTVDITAEKLNKLVADFREAVQNPAIDPRPLGRQLYDILFPAALRKDLAGAEADTIVWSLDGTLRYIPVAALWDGEKYLVERYNNAVITLASQKNLKDAPTERKSLTALGVGMSKEANIPGLDGVIKNFPALPAVPQELCSIVNDPLKKEFCAKLSAGGNGVIDGINLSDEDFTFQNFKLYLGRYPIVHIASHFSLNPGDEGSSYLLLGGDKDIERKLTLTDLKDKIADKLVGTELLTLSACNTAMSAGAKSSGEEIESFGAIAQELGAKSVISSLWSVAAPSTRDLMTEFYKQLENNPKIGKAEALGKAQLALLNGKYKAGEIPLWRRGAEIVGRKESQQPSFKSDANSPSAHPFYWSPFVLIGNWK